MYTYILFRIRFDHVIQCLVTDLSFLNSYNKFISKDYLSH